MGWRVRALAAAALVALLVPAPARGEDEAPGGVPPAPPPAEGEAPAAPVRGDALVPVRSFRLGLREAVALALRNNLDLQVESFGPPIAAASLREAEALYTHLFTARASGGQAVNPVALSYLGDGIEDSEDRMNAGVGVQRLLPTGATISFDATAERSFVNSLSPATEAALFHNPYYQTRVGLNLRQPLLRGFGKSVTEAGVRLARNNRDLASLDLRARTEELVRRVEIGYWLVVGSRGDVEAQLKSVAVAEDLLRIARARLDAGAGTRVDVSQAAAGVAARRVDLLRAENRLRSQEEALLGLLIPRAEEAAGERVRFEPADDPYRSLPPLPTEEIEAAVAEALRARSDVRTQRVVVDQAGIAVLRAESDALVRLDVLANVSYAGLDGNLGNAYSESAASRDFATWNVGLFLEVPIGNRAARARLERANLFRSQAEAQVRALESAAAVLVRNARRDVESTREQIDAARTATALAEEQLAAEKERLANDKSTTFQILQLESDLTDARQSELRALVDYLSAVARYDFEVGRILEARGLAPPETAEDR